MVEFWVYFEVRANHIGSQMGCGMLDRKDDSKLFFFCSFLPMQLEGWSNLTEMEQIEGRVSLGAQLWILICQKLKCRCELGC